MSQLKALATSLDALAEDIQREWDRRQQVIDGHLDRHPGLQQDRALPQTTSVADPAVSLRRLATLRSRIFERVRPPAAFAGAMPVRWESGSSVRGPRGANRMPATHRLMRHM
ncbi:hypothetical protein [Salinicola lusitanus]|uniref:hypothetical protein n=1 Tax=Salinicola lusitanus TaxID=1949085 RepID=UPI0013004C80|nr:hypothetical protein [Salinicola lusitanus]